MKQSYLIGVLFSTSGPYALLGRDALDGALMALAEINEDPAFPFTLAPLTGDPGGVTDRYQTISDALIAGGARHIVGGITSWSRKEMIPVVEKRNALLWYPCPYEGYECSDRVVYVGACPNQHIVPLFAHLVPRFGSQAYLVGSNYIWGWETNRIARKLLEDCGGAVVGERYLPLGREDVDRIVAEIEATRPDFILNNLIGPSSYAFLRAYAALARRNPDFAPERRPVASCDLAECELDQIGEAGIGNFAAAVYFDSLDSEANRRFLAEVRRRFGNGRRVSAFFVCAYMSVRILAEAIRETGSELPEAILPFISSRGFASPMGELTISAQTRHTAFAPLLARIAEGNIFSVVESASVPVDPDPYLAGYLRPIGANAVERPALRVVRSSFPSIGIPNFRGWSAIILHRPHAAAEAITRQLERIGATARVVWPEIDATGGDADVVFFDADLGHDGQFPWPPGEAPMPLIALLGSEAPGRVEWAIGQGADAHILKPIGSAGVYSALVIARHAFAARRQLLAEIDDMRDRLRRRPTVARAVIAIMQGEKMNEAAAFRRLRQIAMETRRTIEDAAETVIARYGTTDDARDSA